MTDIPKKTQATSVVINGQIIHMWTLRRIKIHGDKATIYYRNARGKAVHINCSRADAGKILEQL